LRDAPLPLKGRVAAKRSGGVAEHALDPLLDHLRDVPSAVYDIGFIDAEDIKPE
jgi:hypothetical protein